MTRRLDEVFPPRILPAVSTRELRDNLAETINRAAFGTDPVLVLRRGRNVAAFISMPDLAFLEHMKRSREEAFSRALSADGEDVRAEIGRQLQWEMVYGCRPRH